MSHRARRTVRRRTTIAKVDVCPQTTAHTCGYQSVYPCLLYTSDAADDLLCVDLGGRRIIKKK